MNRLSKNKIKSLRSLQLKKNRDELGLYVVEGEKMVKEALLYKRDSIETLLHTDDFIFEMNSNFEILNVTNDELKQFSSLKTPNKAFAVLRKSKAPNLEITNELVIAIDGIQDPGNLGTILRLADWFGISQVVCSLDTVDCYNSKVIQSSMGAIFRLNVAYDNLENRLRETLGMPIFGALMSGASIYQTQLKRPGILLVGNEGNGISDRLLPLITHPITIPRFGSSESLNVSVATGIIVSEFYRSY